MEGGKGKLKNNNWGERLGIHLGEQPRWTKRGFGKQEMEQIGFTSKLSRHGDAVAMALYLWRCGHGNVVAL